MIRIHTVRRHPGEVFQRLKTFFFFFFTSSERIFSLFTTVASHLLIGDLNERPDFCKAAS